MTEKLTEDDIKIFITESPEFAISCLKELNKTNKFTSFDREMLSSFAKQVDTWEKETTHKYSCPLSIKQRQVLSKRLIKYLKTLSIIME